MASTDVRLALSVPTFADPGALVDLGVAAEASGWDGVLLWDHAHGSPDLPVPTADPWVTLGALAVRTERIVLGTAITPAARRRPQKLARETVTVDHLSGGRMVLGVGLGEPPEEYTAYGETADRRVVADKLDETLEVLARMWSGEPFDHHGPHLTVERAQMLPPPLQRPRIPVWASCMVPHTRPLQRAARWDGAIVSHMDDGQIVPVALDHVRRAAAAVGDGDVVVGHPGRPDDERRAELVEAGATWVLVTGQLDELEALAQAEARG